MQFFPQFAGQTAARIIAGESCGLGSLVARHFSRPHHHWKWLGRVVATIFLTYLDPGDEIILDGVRLRCTRFTRNSPELRWFGFLYHDDLTYDVDGIIAALTPATKVVMLATNNPTGTVLSHDDIVRIATAAAR